MSFLRNVWYVAAWASELADGAMLARTIADHPVVFFRKPDGALACLEDRCPHRFAPLSCGHLDDGVVQCGYHGLRFDPTGACVGNPHGPIPRGLAIRTYPVVERHKILWIWMGEGEGDADAFPDLSFVDRAPASAFSNGYLPTAASHKLMVDNILDLSHADFLHPTSLGGGSITRTRANVEERGQQIYVEWISPNETPLPIWGSRLPAGARADMWTSVLWHPNGVMILRTGATVAGKPREEGFDTWNAHIMTPESAGSTHYFYCNTRDYQVDDEAFNRLMAEGLRAAFSLEDKPMIEAQQRRIGDADLMALHPALLSIDVASTRARRQYDRLLAEESAQA